MTRAAATWICDEVIYDIISIVDREVTQWIYTGKEWRAGRRWVRARECGRRRRDQERRWQETTDWQWVHKRDG
jgi:hypothetical protein